MKHVIIICAIMVTAILFGGCSQQEAISNAPVVQPATKTQSATPVTDLEDPEVKAANDVFDTVNNTTDFKTYSATDIQE